MAALLGLILQHQASLSIANPQNTEQSHHLRGTAATDSSTFCTTSHLQLYLFPASFISHHSKRLALRSRLCPSGSLTQSSEPTISNSSSFSLCHPLCPLSRRKGKQLLPVHPDLLVLFLWQRLIFSWAS